MDLRDSRQIKRPTHIPDYADFCLRAIAQQELGDKISLGGAFGLLHYLDYRATFDVDAWWTPDATNAERQRVISAIEAALHLHGQVQNRTWGEVVSIELLVENQKHFSFQIAVRAVQLEPSQSAEWVNIQLDSLSDLVASKMVALIERGAPRDFRDIHAVCLAKLITPEECWRLWKQRQQLAKNNADFQRAKLAIETHLARIERQRPIEQIAELEQRTQAEQVRQWYKTEFLDANLD